MVEKYFIEFCDDFNTKRRISILDRDFTGDTTELTADVNPLSIDYQSESDFKFTPIRPKLASINMLLGDETGVDFEEFWTSDERRFKVEVKNELNVIEWTGFVIPNGFSYELKGGIYSATLEASDGLGLLEGIEFKDDNGLPYGNQDLTHNNGFEFPISLIITEILRKTGLNLDLWTRIDSLPKNSSVGAVPNRFGDALSAAFVNVKTYIKSNDNEKIPYWYSTDDVWNCKEVLENLLNMFGAKIYQEDGVFKVESITPLNKVVWTKYNSVNTYLGFQDADFTPINIPCVSEDGVMLEDNHTVTMIEALKSFRMNYEYTFLRDGDTPFSLLKNGSFEEWNNTSIFSAPKYWTRKKFKRQRHTRIKPVDITGQGVLDYTTAIQLGDNEPFDGYEKLTSLNPYTKAWLQPSLFSNKINLNRGDVITLSLWQKMQHVVFFNSQKNRGGEFAGMYRMIIKKTETDSFGKVTTNAYVLSNDPKEESLFRWNIVNELQDNYLNADHFYLNKEQANNYNKDTDSLELDQQRWYSYNLKLPKMPINGELLFHVYGMGWTAGFIDSQDVPFLTYGYTKTNGLYVKRPKYKLYVPTSKYTKGETVENILIAGVDIGLIPESSELPEGHDYIYDNPEKNVSEQIEPITVFNGDTQDGKHISNIIVPSAIGDRNFWDTFKNDFGYSSLGLLTVRQIMQQYQKPFRMLEGSIRKQNAKSSSTYTFDAIPNKVFMLHRGTFNYQKQYIEDATFLEILSDELPNGGTENGNTLEPIWQNTGVDFCERGADGLNTGNLISEQIDINPSSETFNETRELLAGGDIDFCPIGANIKYYYSVDENAFLGNDLKYKEIVNFDDEEIEVPYTNENEPNGSYLYFVYLKELNDVQKITTLTTPLNVLDDWVFLSDTLIDGYIYRVARTRYKMSEFKNYNHKFIF